MLIATLLTAVIEDDTGIEDKDGRPNNALTHVLTGKLTGWQTENMPHVAVDLKQECVKLNTGDFGTVPELVSSNTACLTHMLDSAALYSSHMPPLEATRFLGIPAA